MLRSRSVRLIITAPVLAALFLSAGCVFKPDTIIENPCTDCTAGPIENPQDLIDALALAYRNTDYTLFETLLSPDYLFLYTEGQAVTQWGAVEELRIHKRMFEPENPPPGDDPVPADLWLVSVTITLTEDIAFVERPEFYVSETNPEGLDPARWKAEEAIYKTDVFFGTAGDTDYQVTGKARFVVIQDLNKEAGAPGSFLIYRWEDQGAGKVSARSPA